MRKGALPPLPILHSVSCPLFLGCPCTLPRHRSPTDQSKPLPTPAIPPTQIANPVFKPRASHPNSFYHPRQYPQIHTSTHPHQHDHHPSPPPSRLPGGPLPPRSSVVEDMAWDPSGRRLAVLLKAPHPAAGLIALYSTSVSPVVRAELVGFARPLAGKEGLEDWDEGREGRGQVAAIAFAQKLAKGGAVLSVMGRGREGELRVGNLAMAI